MGRRRSDQAAEIEQQDSQERCEPAKDAEYGPCFVPLTGIVFRFGRCNPRRNRDRTRNPGLFRIRRRAVDQKALHAADDSRTGVGIAFVPERRHGLAQQIAAAGIVQNAFPAIADFDAVLPVFDSEEQKRPVVLSGVAELPFRGDFERILFQRDAVELLDRQDADLAARVPFEVFDRLRQRVFLVRAVYIREVKEMRGRGVRDIRLPLNILDCFLVGGHGGRHFCYSRIEQECQIDAERDSQNL